MHVLFPRYPFMHKLPEPIFEPEFDAAKSLGFTCLLFNEEAFSTGDIDAAFKRLPPGDGETLVYRGWIQTEERYRVFHDELAERGYALVSTPSQYAEVTYVPNYFPKIREKSPATVWTDTPDPYAAWLASRKLGNGPFVLKDHVKSAKHAWHDACFVPKNAGREEFERIAENLKREQGKAFFRGFVVKQFVPLRRQSESPREYPLCEEYRLFFWNSRLLIATHYHQQPSRAVDWTPFVEIAQRFDAPFFTMDVAQTEAGHWIIVDMGSGECSSLPPSLLPEEFYSSLSRALPPN